jgi:S-adenosylmethionine decarboxylase
MAYQDALFQLGMDLTRSSTAQKEDHGEPARVISRSVVSEPAADRSEGTDGYKDRGAGGNSGSHLIIDLFGATKLDDAEHVESTLRRCAEVVGAPMLLVHLDAGAAEDGISGVAMVGGGHISIHTDPATGYAALDIFLRNGVRFGSGVQMVRSAFGASKAVVRETPRGIAEAEVERKAAALRATSRSAKARTKVRKAA